MTEHILYKDGDKDVPNSICDCNGQVALAMCKYCGAAEIDLTYYTTCEDYYEMLDLEESGNQSQ